MEGASTYRLLFINFFICLEEPNPPIVGKVTSHSISLYWREADHAHTSVIQEKDKTSLGSFITVYE